MARSICKICVRLHWLSVLVNCCYATWTSVISTCSYIYYYWYYFLPFLTGFSPLLTHKNSCNLAGMFGMVTNLLCMTRMQLSLQVVLQRHLQNCNIKKSIMSILFDIHPLNFFHTSFWTNNVIEPLVSAWFIFCHFLFFVLLLDCLLDSHQIWKCVISNLEICLKLRRKF